jgi:hypothetical protein
VPRAPAIAAARIRLDLVLAGRASEAAAWESAGLGAVGHPYWDVVDAIDALPFYRDGSHRVHRWPQDRHRTARNAIERFLARSVAELGA